MAGKITPISPILLFSDSPVPRFSTSPLPLFPSSPLLLFSSSQLLRFSPSPLPPASGDGLFIKSCNDFILTFMDSFINNNLTKIMNYNPY